jgi:hypothetical protein
VNSELSTSHRTESEYLIIKFNSNVSNKSNRPRINLLNRADLVVYVFGSHAEVATMKTPLRLGRNEYEHEYNLLHFVFKKKTIHVTFDTTVVESATRDYLVLPNENRQLLKEVFKNTCETNVTLLERFLFNILVARLRFSLKLTQDWSKVSLVRKAPGTFLDEYEIEVEGDEDKCKADQGI